MGETVSTKPAVETGKATYRAGDGTDTLHQRWAETRTAPQSWKP
ncbi:hypothetical protein [Streptomyces sp. NBC_01744]|nr:hypothetical protein OIE70_38385 [Streptomyces sp. NBC_01744]